MCTQVRTLFFTLLFWAQAVHAQVGVGLCRPASKDVSAARGTHAVWRRVLHRLQADAAHNARWRGCLRACVAAVAAAVVTGRSHLSTVDNRSPLSFF